jgi:two-component system sensor histidine kinase RegB
MPETQAQTIRRRAELLNLQLLVWLRWFAVAGMAVTVCFTHFLLGVPLPLWHIGFLLAFLVAVNLAAAWRLRLPGRGLAKAVVADVLVDVAALTILLFMTGGAQNPFTGLFILQAIVAAFLLPPVEAGIVFVATVAAYFWLLGHGLPIGLPGTHGHSGPHVSDLHLQGMFLSFFFSSALATLFIMGIRDNLRQRDERLDRIARQIEEEKVVMRLGLLAGTAAHDISTPLTNLAVILDDWLDLGLPGEVEQRRQIALMQEAVSACRESLSHMLAMGGRSRLEAAHATEPMPLLREVGSRWQARYPEVQLIFAEDTPSEGRVLADLLLTRALMNLLDNAREAGARKIVLSAEDRGGAVAMLMRDDGCGFPPAVLQGVVPPVADGAAQDGSHGLGLLLVRSALRRMGGALQLSNRPEGGAEVAVLLPAVTHGAARGAD